MSTNPYSVVLESYRSVLEDRASVFAINGGWVIAVADGAGGISHGDRAADLFINMVAGFLQRPFRADDERTWTTLLAKCDADLYHESDCGQTTAIVLALTPDGIWGASVGDSEAWVSTPTACHVLTAAQRRKPFLGSGCSAPTPFRHKLEGGMLLVATDGLFKYSGDSDIRKALNATPAEACRRLDGLVRLHNGTLQDDLGIVVFDLSHPSS